MKPMKLKIAREKWGRGASGGYLLGGGKEEDKMCCLGFLALSCGFIKKDIAFKDMPKAVRRKPKRHKALWEKMIDKSLLWNRVSSSIACDLSGINDDTKISNETREKRISQKFKEINVDVIFTGGSST